MRAKAVPALGAALLLSIASPGMSSAGPLEVLPAGSLTSMTYNYLTGRAKGVWNDVRDPRVAAINTAAETADHKSWVRARVLERIGGLPAAANSLNVRFAGTLDRDGYKIDKLIYQSQANLHVTANLYRPEAGTPPFPAVVGIPGHATEGKAYPDYQKVWIALARRGFVVLAVDPFGHGERFEHWERFRASTPVLSHARRRVRQPTFGRGPPRHLARARPRGACLRIAARRPSRNPRPARQPPSVRRGNDLRRRTRRSIRDDIRDTAGPGGPSGSLKPTPTRC